MFHFKTNPTQNKTSKFANCEFDKKQFQVVVIKTASLTTARGLVEGYFDRTFLAPEVQYNSYKLK